MGYTTRFTGALKLSRELTMTEAKWLLECNADPDAIKGAKPQSYMQWVPAESLEHIVWDGGEKFYNYIEWLQWLCEKLAVFGIEINGTLYWSGEDITDNGRIEVCASKVTQASSSAPLQSNYEPLTLSRLREIALDQVTRTLEE